MKYFYLLILVFCLVSCKQSNGASNPSTDIPATPIADPVDEDDEGDIVDIPQEDTPQEECGKIDHSCRNPPYMTTATKEECEYMNDWMPGDDDIFYFQLNIDSTLGYVRIDKDGIIMMFGGTPDTDAQNDSIFLRNEIVESINNSKKCQFHVIDSLTGITHTKWSE